MWEFAVRPGALPSWLGIEISDLVSRVSSPPACSERHLNPNMQEPLDSLRRGRHPCVPLYKPAIPPTSYLLPQLSYSEPTLVIEVTPSILYICRYMIHDIHMIYIYISYMIHDIHMIYIYIYILVATPRLPTQVSKPSQAKLSQVKESKARVGS